ncbi:MAG TPA: lysophospholipid acyltransferase family protein [Candidatus Acidoferrales bacterium]|nr:lysophospholipid acyltransferase family protein [Candidatus Acidoferrales bacterium]
MIRTFILVFFFALAIVLLLPWLILWTLVTRDPVPMYRVSMGAVRFTVRAAGVRVRLEGVDNIPAGVCIFAANHVSNIDPLAFVPLIPRRVSLLMKKELFRIPLLSFGMRMAGFVPVDRASRDSASASLAVAVRHLKNGLSFAVYPEGTRSSNGRLRPFKGGAFVMAIQAGVPIVPVSIVGARKLLPKGQWALRPGEIVIRFGPPVDASQFTVARRSELVARVESLVAAGLPPEQQPLPRSSRSSA